MKQLSGMRPADRRLGDDTTFTRFVRLPAAGRTQSRGAAPAPSEATRTRFLTRVTQPSDAKNLLVSGHSNIKIGRDVRVGKLKGYWLYTLSLEERRSCPRSCSHWRDCYGNAMPFAQRVDHTAPDFMPLLEAELEVLLARAAKRPGAPGIIVRLHALGDFYSPIYVLFWERMLRRHPKLVVFGYTAWEPTSPIGRQVSLLIDEYPSRAMLRFSNGGMTTRSTVPIRTVDDCPPGAFVCPEQTGQFEACGKCGACWATLKNVAFVDH